MVSIKIKQVILYHVCVPLKKPFTTHLQQVSERESILVEIVDEEGNIGVGECVAFSSPWYTEETIASAWDVLEKWVVPSILNHEFFHPNDAESLVSPIKRNRMAKSSINQAIWDLYAKKLNRPLWQVIGGTSRSIEAGIVIAAETEDAMISEIESAVHMGYKRIKVKLSQNSKPEQLKKIIAQYPATLFFGDANGAFTEKTIPQLQALDVCGFTLIEQPFSEEQNRISAKVQIKMKTPFALDESITSFQDVEEMHHCKSGKIIVMKLGRVGGLSNALKIHDYCLKNNIPLFVGGMIEFGVSKAFNVAFASLPGVKYPGDFSSSSHFWKQDLSEPTIEVDHGKILALTEHGVGVTLNHDIIMEYEVRRNEFFA